MKPVLLATHEYRWALFPFMHLYRKFWTEEPIDWYGDKLDGPVPDGVVFHRVPCYAEGSWPWEHWFGNGLISILKELEDDIVCLFPPDHWPSEPVNIEGIELLERYMRDNPDVLYGNLITGTCLDRHRLIELPGIVGAKDGPYCGGLEFCSSLWRREGLLGLLERHWDLWDCEKFLTQKFYGLWPRWRAVGVHPAPVRRVNGFVHTTPRTVYLSELTAEDRLVVRRYLPGAWKVIT